MEKKQSKSSLGQIFSYLHNSIKSINDSKIFAGLMIITLNIVSKFVNIKLSKTMEAYLKFSFSRQILVFAIAWMGTRDIYIALFITFLFVMCSEYLFHEESRFFVLSEEFKDYHISLLDNEELNKEKVTEEDIRKAKDILKRAKMQELNVDDEKLQGYAIK